MTGAAMDLDQLGREYGLEGQVRFETGPGGLPRVVIENEHAQATATLHGGHVTGFQPRGERPVLWVSSQAEYRNGKAIRGGIPVCWPWFADHPTDPGKPAHGLVRTIPWSFRASEALDSGETRIRMGVTDDAASRGHWPHPFDLEITVTVGRELRVDLDARNPGPGPYVCGGALHSYFAVGDVERVLIEGLASRRYVDKVDGFKIKTQEGPVRISGETDSIYLDVEGECRIEDPVWKRRIGIGKSGSRTTVVWNPGAEKARAMKDFADDEAPTVVCVETANAAEDVVEVAPGGSHRLTTVIGCEPG